MFKPLGESLKRFLPGLHSFQLGWRFDRAMNKAATVVDLDERVNWCDRAYQIADALEPWPSPTPSRAFALGSLHAMRGQTYLELRARDYKAFSRLALADLEAGAKLLTPADGTYWAQLMNILSTAYAESVDGNPADNRERAIQAAEAALSAVNPLRERGVWLEIMNNLGGYYAERLYGVPRDNHNKALSILQRAHAITSFEYDPREWAMLTMTLGITYFKRNGNEGQDVETAIELLESTLPVLSRETSPPHWAGVLMSLALCYEARVKGDTVRNVELAIQKIDLALSVLTREQTPAVWAGMQMNRGGLYARRTDGDRTSNMECAVRAYEEALTVFTPDTFPVEHAQLLLNLSQAHESITVGPKREHTEAAVEHARAAVASISREAAPPVWALANICLGNALRVRRGGEQQENIEEAIAVFETALEALDPGSDAELWSMAKSALANALAERLAGDQAENLERALLHQQEALEVINPVTAPREWAYAHQNLAISFGERLVGSRADNTERAIALAELGLVVLNCHDHASQRSELLETLGQGFEYRIRGDRIENLHRAVEAYDDAWMTRNRNENPEAWLRLRQRRLRAIKLLHKAYVNRPQPTVDEERSTPLSRRMASVTVADPQEFLEATRDAASSVSPEDHPRTWTAAQEDLAHAQQLLAVGNDFEQGEFLTELIANTRESIKIYEGMLVVNPKEIRPRLWARTRRLMATDYTLLHMFADLKHRGPDGLADRARLDLPNRSEEAMQYLTLASEAMRDVLSVHTPETDAREHLTTAVQLGSCHIWRRDWEAAAAAFASAGVAADRLLGDLETCESEVRDALRALGDLSTAGPFVEVINGRLLHSLELLEVGRARLLAKALKLTSLPLPDDKRVTLNDLLQKISIQERDLTAPNLIDRTTPLDEAVRLRREFSEILAKLDSSVISPTVDTRQLLTEVTSEGAAVVVPLLTDAGGRILIGYSAGGDVTLEVAATNDVITLEQGIFRTHVREGWPGWLDAYKELVESRRPDLDRWDRILEATAESLGELIATPILHELNAPELDCTRLDILPQGPLGLLPLNLARDAATGAALIDRFEVSLSPSLTVLADVRRRKRQAKSPRTIAVIQQPQEAKDLDPLEYIEVEADLVTSWFEKHVVSDGRRKSKKEALASLVGKDIWHFACHGKFDLNAPLNSRLGPLEDGWLTLEDLFDARGLGNPQLVVLSACSTGLYDTRELPSEFIGLPNAFLQLGATAVVATLWPVEDIATALLVGRFYDEYLGGGKPSCSALRAAQLWLRTARVDDLRRAVDAWASGGRIRAERVAVVENGLNALDGWKTHPFAQPSYWAAFVHFGA